MGKPVNKKLELLRKLYGNIELFGKTCLSSAYKKETPEFHGEVYKVIEDKQYPRILIAAPRGTAKSTMTSLILPMYNIAFKKKNEDVFMVIISESRPQSVNFLSRIKSHLTDNGVFKTLFGDLGEDTATRWREDDIRLANGVRIVAIGTGSRIRGFIEKDTRPTLIIMDDIESESNAATPEARAKNRKWVTEAVLPSMADDGRAIMIGTVISEDCFLYWAKDSPAWKVLWYSIIDDNGDSIWNEKYPLSRIKKIKAEFASVGNLNGFFQEYMNQAQSPENAPFQPKYIRTHSYTLDKDMMGQPFLRSETAGREDEEIVRIPIDIYQGVDPASSLKAHADYFVIATIGIDSKGKRYVIDIFDKRIPPSEQPKKIIDKFLEFKPVRVKIETVAYQEALRDGTRALMREMGIYIPGLESGVRPRNSKSERLLSLVPMFAKGDFFFRAQDIVAQQQFLSYPKGKHDDIMDAIWTATQKTYPCRRTKIASEDVKKEVEMYKSEGLDWHVL